MKNGYKVIDIDTHVNPSYDTLVKYVEPSFRSRLDELTPYLRTVGSYTALSLASISPFCFANMALNLSNSDALSATCGT